MKSADLFFCALCALCILPSCANKNKAEVLPMEVVNESAVGTGQSVGVDKDGDMIYRKKVLLSEEIRRLKNDVIDGEDRVYGTRKYNTKGLVGKYEKCFHQLPLPQREGLPAIPKINRISESKEEAIQWGIDPDNNKLAGLTEEKLVSYLEKYKGYQKDLRQQEDDLQSMIGQCESRFSH